ncbi:hypothetical protein ACFX1Q_001048 [Malus domestica]
MKQEYAQFETLDGKGKSKTKEALDEGYVSRCKCDATHSAWNDVDQVFILCHVNDDLGCWLMSIFYVSRS